MRPVVAIYSTFLQRAYDQLIHDVVLQNLPVVFAIDRAGVVGADGATHIGAFDLCYLRCLPNTTVMTPSDENECRQMLYTASTLGSPAAVRYPRGAGPGVADRPRDARAAGRPWRGAADGIAPHASRRAARVRADAAAGAGGGGGARRDGRQHAVREAARRRPRPASSRASTTSWSPSRRTSIAGGAGSGVAEVLAAAGIAVPILHLGLPDHFVDHGDPAFLLAHVGLDAKGIAAAVRARFGARPAAAVGEARRLTASRGGEHPLQSRLDRHEPTRAARPLMPIPDVQSGTDERRLAIDQVGIRGLRYPLAFADHDGVAQANDRRRQRVRRAAGGPQGHAHVAARDAARGAGGAGRAAAVGRRAARAARRPRRAARRAGRADRARLPVLRAQVGAGLGHREPARLRGPARRRARRTAGTLRTVAVAVPVTSLCPCSKEISEYGAHNQRSTVTITVRGDAPVFVHELLRIAEEEASSRALRRPEARRREVRDRARVRQSALRRGPRARRRAAACRRSALRRLRASRPRTSSRSTTTRPTRGSRAACSPPFVAGGRPSPPRRRSCRARRRSSRAAANACPGAAYNRARR